ncbi:nucleoside phosphorylase [Rhodobium orientis]|uniref:Nucleoside phosphorylase domain-containing protein n=1 Tax=Rhodobium orientis TaxID=34017 RepID=A0A327JUQ4_9HYPH|nr:5'-methylthioadenosine/S-adenosylhomocysteine nucleosidase [Rhodobium orientis]MBB4303126.1 nucleoside phosphorylase [Rhodobium orientis]MBK5951770.1 hypothetical protein [Rhodobium orientis]RAI26948.1 hypothetical protein CH339_12230 [Rhodobium orientis]
MNDELQCPLCGGAGHTKDFHIGRGQFSGRCPFCYVSLRFSKQKGDALQVEVSGTNADDVERVLSSALQKAHTDIEKASEAMNEPSDQKADVAILVALDKELDSVLKADGKWSPQQYPDDIRTYYLTTTPTGVSVVAARSSGMGQLGAALLARDVISRFHPKKVILVGIAAGIGDDVSLGDIVISDQVVDYELGKVTDHGVMPRWSVHRSDALLRERLVDYRDDTWLSKIAEPRPEGSPESRPAVHTGVVLSGNKVIADSKTAGSLSAIWTRAIALEMEAAGIAAALHQSAKPIAFVMVKGICDHANSSKNDSWQKYAADVAAVFTISFVYDQLTSDTATSVPRERNLPKDEVGLDMRALRFLLGRAFDLDLLPVLSASIG